MSEQKVNSAITDPAQDLTDNESLVGKLLAYLVIPNLRTKSWSEDELQRVVDEAGHHIHGILLKKAYEVGVFTKNGAMYFVDDDALDSQIYNFAGYLSSNTTRSDIYHNIYKSWKDVITATVESVPEQDNNYVDILSLFMYSIAYDNGSVCYCGEVCEKWQ